MKNVSELYTKAKHPVRILQFGEGNFLRAFVDYAVDVANEENGFDGGVAVIMPRSGKTTALLNRMMFIRSACAASRMAKSIKKTGSLLPSRPCSAPAMNMMRSWPWLTKIRWNSSYRIRRKPALPLMKKKLLQIARRRLSRQN